MVQTSYPGVYIDEFAPPPPIQPAGTSVTAFIGAATSGAINVPTQITSFNQFVSTYGARPINGFYLWYAVRGFFDNGGTNCFVIRASNGKYARDVLTNQPGGAGSVVFRVQALQLGVPTQNITVTAQRVNRLTQSNLNLFAIPDQTIDPSPWSATPPADKKTIAFKTASGSGSTYLFRPGDTILIVDTGDQATVLSVDGVKNTIRVDRVLDGLTTGTHLVRLAPLPSGSATLSLAYTPTTPGQLMPPDALVPGTMLTINANATDALLQEVAIVDSVGVSYVQPPPPTSSSSGPPQAATVLYNVTLRDALDQGYDRDTANLVKVQSEEFTLTVAKGTSSKIYPFLAVDPVHPRYAPAYVNALDSSVQLSEIDPPPAGSEINLLPADGAFCVLGQGLPISSRTVPNLIQAGAPEQLEMLPQSPTVFTDALNSLVTPVDPTGQVPVVNLVAIPDIAVLQSSALAAGVQQQLIAHCENMGDRFAVLDAFTSDQDPFADKTSDPAISKPDSIETQRNKLLSTRGYAALYYPWIRVLPSSSGPLVSVPPCGHICGLFAQVDATRGVHKAPANQPLIGAVGITRDMSNVDQGILNLQGINVIRTFTTGGQPIVFGARTTTLDPNWQYVNVRRLFLYLETSISTNLRNSVFEPNNMALWGGLNRTISAFLLEEWHNGALFGAKPADAFYVKIDQTNNSFTDMQLGKLTIEIGVQPTYPAEFIIVRIGIWDGGASVSES